MHLKVGIGRAWVVHLSVPQNGRISCHKLDFAVRPPTVPAVAKPPLCGSVLWWVWPHAEASWGDQRINVEAETYALDDLLVELSHASKLHITTQVPVSDRHLAIVAEDIPVRTLLWAIEVATGLQVRTAANSQPPTILLESEGPVKRAYHVDTNVLLPMAGLGYYSPWGTAVGRELVSALPGGSAEPEKEWIGWRFTDLSLLYRNWIEEEWQRTYRIVHGKPPPPLESDDTLVLWTKAVLVSVALLREDGAGMGTEFIFPTL